MEIYIFMNPKNGTHWNSIRIKMQNKIFYKRQNIRSPTINNW